VAKMNGRKVRSHSVPYVVDWVTRLYREHDIRMFSIIDDGFTSDLDMAKEFCRAMANLNLPGLGFSTPTGIRAQRTDDELLGLMKRAGWEFLCVAPESGSKRTLKRMRKDLNLEAFPETVSRIRGAGLKVHGFFIVGYPGETRQDIAQTSRFIRKCRFDLLFISNFQPLPGTPVYDELVRSGEIREGLIPGNYSDGDRAYTPAGLRGFNFPMFVLREFLWLALSRPGNVPYIFQVVNPRMIGKKIWTNTWNMIREMFSRPKESPANHGSTPQRVKR
jgi:anaerobic magnesium-protoporphyrin IX monomethyl ester cyclase